jgi:uncharacterized protein YjbJ (UPF0337 family)
MTISKSGLENETKGKMKETEGKFRGDLGKATGDASEHVKGLAEEAKGMSDPGGATQADPHPVSGHRTPREIAKDETGAIGQPDVDVIAKEASGKNSP